MTRWELSAGTPLGATDGVNMDGGGSSAMWVNGVIKNVPSDGSERTVANGLMMVNVQPKLVSTAFSAGQTVATTASANIRLGPGTDYYAFTTSPAGPREQWWSTRSMACMPRVTTGGSAILAGRPAGLRKACWSVPTAPRPSRNSRRTRRYVPGGHGQLYRQRHRFAIRLVTSGKRTRSIKPTAGIIPGARPEH